MAQSAGKIKRKFELSRRYRETRVLSKIVLAANEEEAKELADEDEPKWEETIEADDYDEIETEVTEIK